MSVLEIPLIKVEVEVEDDILTCHVWQQAPFVGKVSKNGHDLLETFIPGIPEISYILLCFKAVYFVRYKAPVFVCARFHEVIFVPRLLQGNTYGCALSKGIANVRRIRPEKRRELNKD